MTPISTLTSPPAAPAVPAAPPEADRPPGPAAAVPEAVASTPATSEISPALPGARPRVLGPSLFIGDRKFIAKAVTYGTFGANDDGDLFPVRETVRRDFELMRQAGINTIRTYTTPPGWFFAEARDSGLRVLVGIYWDGRDCNYNRPEISRTAERAVREAVRLGRAFPDVVLAYILANEIPSLTVRFHGRRPIERFIKRLYRVAKEEDPGALVTYANYPSTEYLQLDFLDFHTLNVYLLARQSFSHYLDRMLIQTKGKPLLLGEVGDDSHRKGKTWQADLLDWTITEALSKGVCGLCVFGWADEWVVGGKSVTDWEFGLVDRERNLKPAYDVVRRRFQESHLLWRDRPWPKVSVVVCNYNGAETLDETLRSLLVLDYPDYEIVYVDDGSTDRSLEIARRHEPRIRIIAEENKGLSAARNVGAREAKGSIVAYTDSDAYADPDWLFHLVQTLESRDAAAVGGPNLTPASDGLVAQFIALCPGNPTVVLKDNVEADHIAGVNMAFRRDILLGIGGFDPVHRKAGDDVDICWRIEDAGYTLVYSPTAIVWHHRRPSVRRYVRQQLGYGEAENQLERKYPERFNLGGFIRWRGRVYCAPRAASALFKPFVYHGVFGSALFQTFYQKEPSYFMDGPTMIQWYLASTALVLLSPLSPWLLVIGLGGLSLSMWAAAVTGFTSQVPFNLTRREMLQKGWVVGAMHFVHPVIRWYGRIKARIRHRRPLRTTPRPPAMTLDLLLAELRHLPGGPMEIRRYWGIGSATRAAVIRDIHKEFKSIGGGASYAGDYDTFDLLIHGSVSVDGRLYTAPEYYDQAICLGFRAAATKLARVVVPLGILGAVTTGLIDWRLPFLALLVPALLFLEVLAAKARLRRCLWSAVDAVMERRGAKRFGDGA